MQTNIFLIVFQIHFSTLTRYYFTYSIPSSFSFKHEVYLRTYIAKMRQDKHTRPIKLFHRYSGRQSGRFGADHAPLRNQRKKRDETKQNRSHINHLSQFRGRKDRLRSKSFHWGSVVGCATSQLRAVLRCETGDLRGTKTRNTPLVGTI